MNNVILNKENGNDQKPSTRSLLWLVSIKDRVSRKLDGKYKKIFDAAIDSFIIFDMQGNILDLNVETEKLFECQYSNLIKLSGKDIVHPDYYTHFGRFLKEICSKGYSRCEILNIRKDGSTFFSDLRGRLFEHDGQLNLFAVFREITEHKKMERWTRHLLTHDLLTGLYNRTYFEEEISKLERGRVFPVSIIMIDVDGMKAINDGQGHKAGDELLRRVAHVLRISFRSADVVARIGGDEFAVLLPGAHSEKAKEAILRLRGSISDHNSRAQGPKLNMSVGAASGYQGADLRKVLEEADMNMYGDKISKTRDLRIKATELHKGVRRQS